MINVLAFLAFLFLAGVFVWALSRDAKPHKGARP